MVKPFLTGETVDKIHIYGKDGWKDEVLKLIDADMLPMFLGGNRTDPDGDPWCKSWINFGGVVPDSYFLSNKSFHIKGGKRAVVDRMSKLELKFNVTIPDSNIQWEFMVKTRDIGFSLLLVTNNNSGIEVKELIPKQRIYSDTGVYRCDQTGIYILEFDNIYSWLYEKEIHYNAYLSKAQ